MILQKNKVPSIDVARKVGQAAAPLNGNATNDKNVAKNIIFSLVFFSNFAYNSAYLQQLSTTILIQGARASSIQFLPIISIVQPQ